MHTYVGVAVRRVSLLGCVASCAIAAPALAQTAPAPAPPAVGSNTTPGVTPTLDPSAAVQGLAAGVSPLYGRINPFYGNLSAQYGRINPFYGRINPFYGRINPFFGDVTAYWGRINPFTQVTDAATTAFYGKTDPFWGSANPYLSPSNGLNYGTLNTFWTGQFANWNSTMSAWSAAQSSSDAQNLANSIQNNLVNPISAFWGSTITKQKGDVTAIVKADLLAAGVSFINANTIDPNSLLSITPSQQGMLFLNIYDHLMDFAGTGHIDWWMASTNWSPALAEMNGKVPAGGTAPTIGMIDFAVTQGTNVSKQVLQYGSTVFNDGHGAAVGSLIVGAVDGSGVLGVLPTGAAKVAVYNPYDSTGTTNWTDVGTGVQTLANLIFSSKSGVAPVGVLNASLGVPGWALHPGWNDALANAGAHGHNLVIAAGNDGVMQTQNVQWNFDVNPTLLIVGSVGADRTISNFSNTPGEACLLPTSNASTVCSESNKLKYRFLVAPGELILVSDGNGGHYRQTGTSLAAPLVSGAIAMLQNRWPWLANYPDETASIILKSATPLGNNPGADPIYGAGELNIGASQSPLSWQSLVYVPLSNGKTVPVPSVPSLVGAVLASPTAPGSAPAPAQNPAWASIVAAGVPLNVVVAQQAIGTQASWNASGLSYTTFEQIGNTYRDFYIPLSSKLVGQNVMTIAGGQAYQSYLTAAFRQQIGHFSALGADPAGAGVFANGFERSSAPAGMIGNMQLRVNVAAIAPAPGFRANGNALFQTGAALVGENSAIRFGFGDGASALATGDSFSFRSDHDFGTGGANPVLGLASGGAYLGGRMSVSPQISVGFGTSQREAWRNPVSFGLGAQTGSWVNRYAAAAQTLSVSYAVTPRFVTHVDYTHLREQSALLGIQSLSEADLRGGSATGAATFGFDLHLSRSLVLSGSGTLARTQANGGQLTTNGLTGTAAAFAITKTGIFGRLDQVRLMAASPLHTVGGKLTYSSLGVIDRQTGALGIVNQSIAPASGRLPLTGEVMYGRRLPGFGELSLFGRVEQAGQLTSATAAGSGALGTMGGAQVQLAF